MIHRVARVFADLPMALPATLGSGDDAAVIDGAGGSIVTSVDLLVEDRHFRRDWSSAIDLGVKAVAVSLSDVVAMGARPLGLLVGLALPPDTELSWVDDLASGMHAECKRAGATVLGGDVVSAPAISLSMTAMGVCENGVAPVLRSGAKLGDAVVLCGRLGLSRAGLTALEAGLGDEPSLEAVIDVHLRPEVPYAAARRLAVVGATAMIDISDGLVADLWHVAEASGVGIDIDSAALPIDSALQRAVEFIGVPALNQLLNGGEDYAIVATVPPAAEGSPAMVASGGVVIGRVTAGHGVSVNGRPTDPLARGGFEHF